MTYARIFNDIGGVLVNGGYSGFRIATLKLDEINCGIGDFNKVLKEYGILFSLQDVDEKYISEALVQGKHEVFCLFVLCIITYWDPIVYFIEGTSLSRNNGGFVFIRCLNGTFP